VSDKALHYHSPKFPNMNRFTLKHLVLIAGIAAMLITACKKDDDNTDDPTTVLTTGTVKDHENTTYKTVKIGNQWWMAENLKVTHYRNGDTIGTTYPSILSINGEIDPKYQWAFDGLDANATILGRLYTAHVLTDTRGICPGGWHIPTDAEWNTLISFLGGESVAGAKLKQKGITQWLTPNLGATNESGFTALPGGERLYFGNFLGGGYYGAWWAAPEGSAGTTWSHYVYYDSMESERKSNHNSTGLCVRCIKD
jgi:uncharacterized protein (TIGR02145 family)